MSERAFIVVGKKKIFLSTIEKYYVSGLLGKSEDAAVMRYSAGVLLAQDSVCFQRPPLAAVNFSRIKVDCSPKSLKDNVSRQLRALRYERAVETVSAKCWPVVRLVCVADVDVYTRGAAKNPLHKNSVKNLLIGLDELVSFYEKFNRHINEYIDICKKVE